MGLLGLIVAVFVNLLTGSDTLGLLISISRVTMFLSLTTYSTRIINR